MSYLIKAQQTPQFNWDTCWTSLGANEMPDKLIKEGMKQLDQITISFKRGTKNITGNVAPDQAQFGVLFTLPDFKSKILTHHSDAQKDDGPTLFSLMSQGFQDVDLTKKTSVVAKQCPTEADRTKMNFD